MYHLLVVIIPTPVSPPLHIYIYISLQYRQVNNQFQTQMKTDIEAMNSSDKVYIPADKTRNFYKMDSSLYNKMLKNNITSKYKMTEKDCLTEINCNLHVIASKLDIDDRIDNMAERQAFLTLKDHKESFATNPSCRLINPAKSEMGRVSKIILAEINKSTRKNTKVNQWTNTVEVLNWFSKIPDKKTHTFIMFDIVEFYPSISKELLTEAINWAKTITSITTTDIDIIMHSRESVLFDKGTTWAKKGTNSTFDVTMGGFDGAEICELVGLFALNKLSQRFDKQSIGLYRDDGLAIFRNLTARTATKVINELKQIFQNLGLRITTEVSKHFVNFLDVTLNLQTGTYQPYRKPNDEPVYVNANSNHAPPILKQIPAGINKRISQLSYNKDAFDNTKQIYDEALKSSGHNNKMTYQPTETPDDGNNAKRRRRRNIMWFNPPYNMNVKTNVARTFLNLIKRHFPQNSTLHKIFNKNTIKVSYSCMPNIQQIIKKHNNKILSAPKATQSNTCNCRDKAHCPLAGACLESGIIYAADVTTPSTKKTYIGLTSTQFKTRYNNHTKSFRNTQYETDSELSKFIWELKRSNTTYTIKWKILKHAPPTKLPSGNCNLCLEEKVSIITYPKAQRLNKRSELVSKCRHSKPPDRDKQKTTYKARHCTVTSTH